MIRIGEMADEAMDVDDNATTSTNVTDPAPQSIPIVASPSVDKSLSV